MKAKELKVGDKLGGSEVVSIRSAVMPDRVIVVLRSGETRQLFKDGEVEPTDFVVDRDAFESYITRKLKVRLEYARTTYGTTWKGNDPLSELEEELLDALL